MMHARRVLLIVGASVLLVALETAIFWFALDHELVGIAMLYLPGVVVMTLQLGFPASLLTSGLSVAAYDYFFTAPYFSFAVRDSRSVLTFVIMVFVAFVIGRLTARIRRDATEATEREQRTASLYALSRALASGGSTREVVAVAASHLAKIFSSRVRITLSGVTGAHESYADAGGETSPAPANPALATEVVQLSASKGSVGAVAIQSSTPHYFASGGRRELLEAFAIQIALAIERARFAEDAQLAQAEVQNERLRNALLSSVSHDLRTPLAVVKGAVTALLDADGTMPPDRRRDYLQTISEEASRLNRLVRNLLDMTSLQAGLVRVRKQWHLVEELVGVALNRLDEQLGDRNVSVQIAPDAALIPVDEILAEQVLINLVDNATKYSTPGAPISIRARRVDDGVTIEVADSGSGVAPGQEERIFDKFYRGSQLAGGMGLGLAICRGIIAAHGGRISCRNRSEGGASFEFTVPCDQAEAPSLKALPEAAAD